MRQWVVVPVLLTLLAAPPGAEAKQKIASSRELLQAGFFQDFEELDLEALLGANDARVRVATRTEESLDEAPGAVTVVTAEDIRQIGAHTLEEALVALPGVEVLRDGLGHPRVVIRGVMSGATGGGSENVKILMDGRDIDDPLLGGVTIVNLAMPVANISRIELLRGAASTLYGSGALGGVIDILTFRPEEYQGIEAAVEFGSFGTQRYALRLGSDAGDFKTFGFLQFEDVDGAERRIGADSMTGRGASVAPGPTFDDFRQVETNFRAEWKDWEAAFRIANLRTHGYVGLVDALGDNELSYKQTQISLTWKREVENVGRLRIGGVWTQNRLQQFLAPLAPGFTVPLEDGSDAIFPDGVLVREDLKSRHYGLDSTLERKAGAHTFVAGLSLGRETVEDPTYQTNYDFRTGLPVTTPGTHALGEGEGRTVFGAFLEDSWVASDHLTLTAGLRYDDYSGLGGTVSPRAAAVIALPEDLHLKLVYGRAFRAPTIGETTFDLPPFDANPDLDFVQADSVDAAISYRRKAFRIVATGYGTWLRDAIAPLGPFDPTRSRRAVQGPGTDIRGVEFEVRRAIGAGHSLFVNYAFQDAEVENTSRDVAGIPHHLGNVGATFALGAHLRATPVWAFRSSRPRELGDVRPETEGYSLVNLTVRAQSLYRTLSLAVAGQNIFDKKYFDPSLAGGVPGDYPRAGVRVLVSASYEF